MSWFTDFLTDTARQAAPGIHQGIADDQKKKRDLEVMRQTIPVLVEQQKALAPGQMQELQAKEDAATRRAMMVEELRNKMRGPKAHVVGGRLVGDQGNVLYEPPPAQPTQAEQLMSRVLGPLGSSVQESPAASGPGAGTPQKPSALPPGVSVTSGGVTMRAPGESSGDDTYRVDTGDKVLVVRKGTNEVVREFPRVRAAGMGQGSQNAYYAAALLEAQERGLSGTAAHDFAVNKTSGGYVGPIASTRAAGAVEGGYTGPAREAKAATAYRTGEERAAGAVQGELREIPSPSTPGTMVSGAAAVGEQRERGKIPTQVEKKTSELERTYSLIDQIDALSKPLITAKNWQEVLPQYVRLKIGSFTNANQAATLYESTIEEFLGQLAREVSQERGVLTNQDIGRIKAGLPSFGNTEGVRSGKIALLKNIIRMNQEAENARTASGGRISEEARQAFRVGIERMLQDFNKGAAPSAPAGATGGWSIKPKGR